MHKTKLHKIKLNRDKKSLFGRLCMSFLAAIILISNLSILAYAKEHPIIDDDADLFSEEEEEKLMHQLSDILDYGGVAIVTNKNAYSGSATDLAESLYREYFHKESGILFLIDMYNRRIEFFMDGDIHRVISKARANGIADNIYTYATDGKYYKCASVGFEQVLTLLEGGNISVPMKYVSNLFLAASISLLIVFLCVYFNRYKFKLGQNVKHLERDKSPDEEDQINTYDKAPNVIIVEQKKTKETKVSNSSSSGGSSGGGGGSSGGGGGHGF